MDQKRPVTLLPKDPQPAKVPLGLTLKVARDFYTNTLRDFQLEPHHVTLLGETAFALQRCKQARALIDRDGMCLIDSRNGRSYAHPMLAIERDSKTLFLRGVRELGLDLAESEPVRPPTRSGRATR